MKTRPHIHWSWPELLEEHPHIRLTLESVGELFTHADLANASIDSEILVPRLTDNVDAKAMHRLPKLRIIATPSTGTDHIDLEEARRRSIQVLSLRDDKAFLESLQSTAELSWLLIQACVRRFREANRVAMQPPWDTMSVRGNELIGKTLGIVGLGRLGTMVARFGLAFRMRVLACDACDVAMEGVDRVDLRRLLEESDVISVHVHLDATTRQLIGREQIGWMKPGAVLVNTSRGAVVDESALLEALASRRLSAAGLDVLVGERDDNFALHPLIEYARQHDNLILTPHVGGCTVEAQSKAFLQIARRMGNAWRTLIQKD